MPTSSPPKKQKHPLLLIFLLHSVFLIAIVFFYQRANFETEKRAKSQEIIAAATILSKLYYDAGLAIGAYALTKNSLFGERYQKLVQQIPAALDNLHVLTNEQPVKEITFQEIDQVAQEGLNQLVTAKTTIDSNSLSPFGEGRDRSAICIKKSNQLLIN